MKRFLSLAAVAVLIAAPVQAGDIHAGVRAGLNMADISNNSDPAPQTSFRNGLALGGFVAFPMNEMFSVQPEALFMMKGTKLTETDPESTVKLSYIEIPVLAKVSFMQDAKAQPALFLGPALGFNTGAKFSDGTNDVDVKDTTKSVDFGLVFGGGLDVPVADGAQSVGVDVRYNLGLTNANDDPADTTTEVKNNTLSIMGFWSFI